MDSDRAQHTNARLGTSRLRDSAMKRRIVLNVRALVFVRLLSILALPVIVVGCEGRVEREYVWTRATPALARRTPTTFMVRLRLDPGKKSVVWLEDAYDDDGALGRTTKTWNGCVVFDEENWECKTGMVLGQVIPDDIEMRNGQLYQRYWGEERHFSLRRKVLGLSF